MQREIEAKFLSVNHDDVRAKLKSLKATLSQPMRLMRRVVFDYPDQRLQKADWGRIRVRDEGDRVTLSYKSGSDQEYSKEVEVIVDSYDKTRQLLEAIGLKAFSFQESKRESWRYEDIEIVLDEWPWLEPYIEIEGPSEPAIKDCSAKLGFKWSAAKFGNVDTAYRAQYLHMGPNETIGSLTELRFSTQQPAWLKERL